VITELLYLIFCFTAYTATDPLSHSCRFFILEGFFPQKVNVFAIALDDLVGLRILYPSRLEVLGRRYSDVVWLRIRRSEAQSRLPIPKYQVH
jgi:hypothetical protein